MTPKSKKRIVVIVRYLLGGLFLLSGIGKLIEGSDARYLVELLATEFYWLIEYADFIVIATSIVELVLAGLLFWGKKLTLSFTGAFLLLITFTGILGYFWIQGQSIASCGCFGAFGIGGGLEVTLLRNLLLMALVIGGFLVDTKTPRIS